MAGAMGVRRNPTDPTQPPTLCETGNEYRPTCIDALRLQDVKAGRLIPFVNKLQIKLCDPLNMCHPERFGGEFHN